MGSTASALLPSFTPMILGLRPRGKMPPFAYQLTPKFGTLTDRSPTPNLLQLTLMCGSFGFGIDMRRLEKASRILPGIPLT